MQKVNVNIDIAASESFPGQVGGSSSVVERLRSLYTFPDGTDPGEADAFWADVDTVAAGAIDALELDNLAALPGIGAVTFSKIKGIAVANKSASGYLTLGGGSGGSTTPNADSWSDTDAGVDGSPFSADGSFIRVGAGDVFVWTAKAGIPVVNTTADKLGIEGFVATQSYEILVWGND
jgi:hypothetical protein